MRNVLRSRLRSRMGACGGSSLIGAESLPGLYSVKGFKGNFVRPWLSR
jgi:hypothetical protein